MNVIIAVLKLRILMFLILLLFPVPQNYEKISCNKKALQEYYLNVLWQDILQVESENTHRFKDGRVKISSAGAIGRAQVMPFMVSDYNWQNGTDYLIEDLYLEIINITVGKWLFYRNAKKLKYNYIKTVNAYYMGYSNTQHNGRYNVSYLSKVCPVRWWYFYLENKNEFQKEKNGIWILK